MPQSNAEKARDTLKGVPCDDCFGTYDAHESGCRTALIDALRAANACLVAGLEKADCTCDAEDSYYHSAGCYRCESLARARELLGGKS